jgi:N-acetylmuramoyl-L-alanine amidase
MALLLFSFFMACGNPNNQSYGSIPAFTENVDDLLGDSADSSLSSVMSNPQSSGQTCFNIVQFQKKMINFFSNPSALTADGKGDFRDPNHPIHKSVLLAFEGDHENDRLGTSFIILLDKNQAYKLPFWLWLSSNDLNFVQKACLNAQIPHPWKDQHQNQNQASSPANSSNDLQGLDIGFDVGHGCGSDGICEDGAIGHGGGVNEHQHNIVQTNEAKRILEQQGARVTVYHCTTPGVNCSLSARSALSRKHDLLVSVHNNAADSGAQGTEVWTFPGIQKARTIGRFVNESMNQFLWNNDPNLNRGVKHTKTFTVLRDTYEDNPIILTEGFFVTGSDLAANPRLAETYSKKLGPGIADGIKTWYKNRHRQGLNLLLSSGLQDEDTWVISEPTIGILNH